MSPNDPKCSFATIFILWWEGQANLVSTMRPSAFAKIVSRGKNNMKISISTGLKLWCCHCFAFYRFKSATPAKCHVNVMYDHLSCMIMCYIHLHTVMYGDFMLFVARWSFNSAQEPLELCGQLGGSHHPVEWRRIRKIKITGAGVCHCIYIYNYIYYYIYQIWLLIKNPLSGNGHSSRIFFLSRIFRKLHVYFSRNACWATAPLMKMHSSPAKSHKIITDNFFTAL